MKENENENEKMETESKSDAAHLGMGSNQDFANASRIELSKCECESNRVGHCKCESNQKTANCKSICELRPKKGFFVFLSSCKSNKKIWPKKIQFFCFFFYFQGGHFFPFLIRQLANRPLQIASWCESAK